MKLIKRMIVVFTICILLVLIPIVANAATQSGTCGSNLTWSLTDGGVLTISGSGSMYNYDSGYSGPWHTGSEYIQKIVINSGVTSIGSNAFAFLHDVTSVTIANSVQSIGDYAFGQCNSLSSITIPDSVNSLGDGVFRECENLTSINVASGNTAYSSQNGVLFSKDGTGIICCPGGKSGSYTIPAGVLRIEKYCFNWCDKLTSINIPDSVMSIYYCAFDACRGLISISIPSSVTYIDGYAFYYCKGLKNITIPSSIASIRYNTFDECTSLTSITLPNTITSIEWGAFQNCSSLVDVYFNGTQQQWNAISIENSNTPLTNATIHYSGIGGSCGDNATWSYSNGILTIFGSGAIYDYENKSDRPWNEYASQITSITVSDGITGLGRLAFSSFNVLDSVSLPSTLVEIGSNAFGYCSNLLSLTLPPSLQTIGRYAFFASGISNIWIPKGVISIGSQAFSYCNNLTSINIPSTVTSIGNHEFAYSNHLTAINVAVANTAYCSVDGVLFDLEMRELICFPADKQCDEYEVPDTVWEISGSAFRGCQMKRIVISDGVKDINHAAFANNANLESIIIPSSVMYIGNDIFEDSNNVTVYCYEGSTAHTYVQENNISFTLLTNGGKCGDNAFWVYQNGTLNISGSGPMYDYEFESSPWNSYRDSIQSVILGNNVTTIGDNAFDHCSNLTSITISNSVTYIGMAFNYCTNLSSITIPSGVTFIADYAFEGCSSLTNFNVPNDNTAFLAQNGILFNKNITKLICYPAGKTGSSYNIPSSVTVIGNGAFSGSSLTTITIPNGITTIGGWGFSNCEHLTSITIPDNVNNIGTLAFMRCLSLASINVTNSNTTFASQDGVLFSKDKTTLICYPGGNTGSYAIPANVNHISDHAFYWCKDLSSITIPSSVTIIDHNAFLQCTSLVDVYYSGTEDQWNNISIDYGNTKLTNATIHYLTSYTVTYNANGGTGTPSSQTKVENTALTLSSLTPSKNYVIQYNANGGSVSPASKSLNCTFKKWNTAANGSGTSYAPGATYIANADVTLYAQWANPVAGELATPTRSGYLFIGWFTSATEGEKIDKTSTITGNKTVYARWKDAYNMGDETYSFPNYGDSDSRGGHCFGMSMTSAGYHNGLLDIGIIGGNVNTPLYSFGFTDTVKRPICYYQKVWGWHVMGAIVAGDSFDSSRQKNYSTASDWQAVVNYVSNHNYDNSGLFTIIIWNLQGGVSGHAVNFLRYENVNGQDRIYAYDNNFPSEETYFYRDSSGIIRQAPISTFSIIDSIGLWDCRTYFSLANNYDVTHAIYMAKNAATVEGYSYSYMVGGSSDETYVMYEIPRTEDRIIIIPNRDYADFIYMDTEYSFGEITDETRGELSFASMIPGAADEHAIFRIYEAGSVFGEPDFTLPSALTKIDESAFEGIAASIVYIPDTCTSIGVYAFRNSAIQQIRIPAGCSIASTAFYGCDDVKIFGVPGSAAETFCANHDNCTFVAE